MRRLWLPCFVAFMAFVTLTGFPEVARAHSGVVIAQEQEVDFRVEKLSARAYALYGRGGTIGFLVTDEGILVVDDQFENIAPRIVEEIGKVSDKPIRFLVNTHYHGDHVGGNIVFGEFALIIAHENARRRVLGQSTIFLRDLPGRIQALDRQIEASPDAAGPFFDFLNAEKGFLEYRLGVARDFDPARAAPPVVTFNDRLTVHLGNEEVRVLHFRRGHTDGDAVVYFPDQKIVHMGDLFVGPRFPFIDRLGGGDSAEWIATIDGVLRAVDPDSKFIAGHGEVGTRQDLEAMRAYLVEIRKDVRQAVRDGKTLRQTIETIDRSKYDHIESWFRSLESNIAEIFEEMKGGS